SASGVSSPTTGVLSAAQAEGDGVRPNGDAGETQILDSVQGPIESQAQGADGASESTVRPFYKDEITIGRGSRQVAVDLSLEGDMEVSRKHATLRRRDRAFELTCHGANSLVVNGEREIATGETGEIKPGDKIAISSYELQLRPY
ncbi:MAG: FHA domain-containing protein, partial [Blastocatellia bacterium]